MTWAKAQTRLCRRSRFRPAPSGARKTSVARRLVWTLDLPLSEWNGIWERVGVALFVTGRHFYGAYHCSAKVAIGPGSLSSFNAIKEISISVEEAGFSKLGATMSPERQVTEFAECPWRVQCDAPVIHLYFFSLFRFASGVIASVEVSWLSPQKMRRTCLVGSERMVVYDDTEPSEKVKVYDRGVTLHPPGTFGEFQLTYRSGDMVAPSLENTEPLLTEIEHFLDCVKTGETPRTDGHFGAAVVRAVEMAASHKQGYADSLPDPVPLRER